MKSNLTPVEPSTQPFRANTFRGVAMKSAQTNAAGLRRISLVLASLLATSAYPQLTDLSQTPLPTYSPTSGVDVKPNVLFVLDDSGSMDWDFMPDWATLSNVQDDYRVSNYSSVPPYLRYATGFNGLAYNPAIRYQPPAYFDSTGTRNTTRYPSMTGTSTTSGGDSSASSASPNWKAVPNDGYGVQSTNKTNLNNNAWSYILVAGEYCNSSALRNCTTSSTATGTYAYPAPLRWCTSAALTTCKATWDSSYKYPRAPAPRTATITVNSGSKNTAVNSIKVDSYEILSAATSASSTTSTVAQRIVDNINACTNAQTGNCTAVGYKAYCVTDYWSGNCNSNVVTILAPGASTTPPTITPGNTGSGYLTFTATSFDRQAIPCGPGALEAARVRLPYPVKTCVTRSLPQSPATRSPAPGPTARRT
jgi:type IV pilus assembly protein PilY1